MGTLPPAEVVTTMDENRKLYSEMNQLRVEQQACMQNIEVLQEESYRVTMALAATRGIVKQEVEESVEKMQAQVTA
jgi:predicted  nucleic acid-binding Zn-ribbon protein